MFDGVIDIATKYWKQSGNCLTIYDKVLYTLYMELIKNKENNLRSNDFTQKVAKYDILVVTALRNFAHFYLTEWSMTESGVYWQNYVSLFSAYMMPFHSSNTIKHHCYWWAPMTNVFIYTKASLGTKLRRSCDSFFLDSFKFPKIPNFVQHTFDIKLVIESCLSYVGLNIQHTVLFHNGICSP